MKTEIPAKLLLREQQLRQHFTYRCSRIRMNQVAMTELTTMDGDRCAAELSGARVEVLEYACPVAHYQYGKGYRGEYEKHLEQWALDNDAEIPVVALADAAHAMGAKRAPLVRSYPKPLARQVVDCRCQS